MAKQNIDDTDNNNYNILVMMKSNNMHAMYYDLRFFFFWFRNFPFRWNSGVKTCVKWLGHSYITSPHYFMREKSVKKGNPGFWEGGGESERVLCQTNFQKVLQNVTINFVRNLYKSAQLVVNSIWFNSKGNKRWLTRTGDDMLWLIRLAYDFAYDF